MWATAMGLVPLQYARGEQHLQAAQAPCAARALSPTQLARRARHTVRVQRQVGSHILADQYMIEYRKGIYGHAAVRAVAKQR